MDKKVRDALEQDALIVKERMPMSTEEVKAAEVARSLADFIRNRNISQTTAAKALGISPTKLSQYLANKYPGNLEDLINKAVNYMNSLDRKERSLKTNGFVQTSIAISIKAMIGHVDGFSQREGKIGLVIGDAGHGKSACLRKYAESNLNSIYIELDRTMNATRIFAAIANRLGIDGSGTLAPLAERVATCLLGRQTILMLDEASYLTVSVLDQLRQIVVVKGRCPLILAGNRDLLATVMQKTTRRGYESLDQFTSRILQILDLDRAADGGPGDDGLYTVEDIRRLYQFGGIRLSSGAVKKLQSIARKPGSGRLRACDDIILALHRYCIRQEIETITPEMIDDAIVSLGKENLTIIPATSDDEQDEQIAKTA